MDIKMSKYYNIEEIVGETYDLTNPESRVLLKVNELGEVSVKKISSVMKKDRTTAQKILSRLYKRKIVSKRQVNLDRGFMFVYFIKNEDEFWIVVKNSITKEFNEKMEIVNKNM